MSEMEEALKELVKSKGFGIGMNTVICDNHHKFASNCVGCDCEEGCSRFCHLMIVMAKGANYKPVNFEDSLALDNWTQKQISMVLNKNVSLKALKNEVLK